MKCVFTNNGMKYMKKNVGGGMITFEMSSDLLGKLSAEFDTVRWRKGAGGKMLAYIDARDVAKRLDDVCGVSWQCKYEHLNNGTAVCSIGILIDGEWVWRADGSDETDIEASKGALSRAFVRAASRWGIGRYLYDLKPQGSKGSGSKGSYTLNGRKLVDIKPPKYGE